MLLGKHGAQVAGARSRAATPGPTTISAVRRLPALGVHAKHANSRLLASHVVPAPASASASTGVKEQQGCPATTGEELLWCTHNLVNKLPPSSNYTQCDMSLTDEAEGSSSMLGDSWNTVEHDTAESRIRIRSIHWNNTWYYRLLPTVLCPPAAAGGG